MPIKDLTAWFSKKLSITNYEKQIAKRILIEIDVRLKTLLNVGLNYLL